MSRLRRASGSCHLDLSTCGLARRVPQIGGLPLMSAWPLKRFGERGHVIEVAHQLMVQVARTQPELLAG